MIADGEPWRIVATGLCIRVRLTPRASQDGIAGVARTADGPALRIRVRAVPEAGAANAAAAKVIAEGLGVASSSVALATGAKSRMKTFMVFGAGPALAAAADGLLAEPRVSKERRNA